MGSFPGSVNFFRQLRMLRLEFAGHKAYHGGNFSTILKSVFCGAVLSSGEGQSWRRAPPGFRFLIFRRCFQSDGAVSRRKLLIYTAANNEKAECGRTLRLADTAAIRKRQSCGRADCSFIRPQIEKRRNAAVRPSSPIRPQLKKNRVAAVRIAHLYGRK